MTRRESGRQRPEPKSVSRHAAACTDEVLCRGLDALLLSDRRPEAVSEGMQRLYLNGEAGFGDLRLADGLLSGMDAPSASPAAATATNVSPVQFLRDFASAAPANAGAVAAAGLATPAATLPFLDRIQASFGEHDVSGVRAHQAAEACETLGARAFATGEDVAFRGAPDLKTAAHEAAHVVQQRGGVRLPSGTGRAGDEHERHADAVAARVLEGRSASDLLARYEGGPVSGAVQFAEGEPGFFQRQLLRIRNVVTGGPVQQVEMNLQALEEAQRNADRGARRDVRGYQNYMPNFAAHDLIQRYGNTVPAFREYEGDTFGAIMAIIRQTRELIDALTPAEAGMDAQALQSARSGWYLRINRSSPYFTQLRNNSEGAGWAPRRDPATQQLDPQFPTWRRTCAITSLSMALSALGKSAESYTGDRERLVECAKDFEPETLKTWADVAALRLPEFLIMAALSTAWRRRASETREARLTRTTDRTYITATIETAAFVEHMGAQIVKSSRLDATGLSPEAYKTKVLADIAPQLAAGNQVCGLRVVRGGGKHWTRIQEVDDAGIVVDDPAYGQNNRYTWAQAKRADQNALLRYLVFR